MDQIWKKKQIGRLLWKFERSIEKINEEKEKTGKKDHQWKIRDPLATVLSRNGGVVMKIQTLPQNHCLVVTPSYAA
jgi:hypothetical protein